MRGGDSVQSSRLSGKIHPAAIVSDGAELGPDVEVGPYSIIGPHVKIGRGTRILSHVVIEGFTSLGERCDIFHGVFLGGPPQDKKFKPCEAYLSVGNDNVFREYVTIHHGSTPGSRTAIGDRNFLMVGAHVGHDCEIGNDVVIVNGCALGGHVQVEDKAFIGGFAAAHQFTRIGRLSMVGGKTKIVRDVPPFSVCDGNPARFFGLNTVGLKRAGYRSKDFLAIRNALKTLFASGYNLSRAVKIIKDKFPGNAEAAYLISFVEKSKRGVTRSKVTDEDVEG